MKKLFDDVASIILVFFIIIYAIGFVINTIETTKNIIDVWENGFPIFREGYIPPSKRKVEGVKFVPEGADPRDYIKDD